MTEVLVTKMNELRALFSQAENEMSSLIVGKKAACPRVRSSLHKIKTIAHTLKADVTVYTKTLPTKHRVKKDPDDESPEPVVEPIEPVEALIIEPAPSVVAEPVKKKVVSRNRKVKTPAPVVG